MSNDESRKLGFGDRSLEEVLLERDDVDGEGERQRERRRGVVAPHRGIERGRLREAQVELVEADGLDDLQHTAVREDGLDLESLDTLVEPSDLKEI